MERLAGLSVSATEMQERIQQFATLPGRAAFVAREDAHRFYLQQNFQRLKTSAVFIKRLTNRPVPEQGTFHESRFTPLASL